MSQALFSSMPQEPFPEPLAPHQAALLLHALGAKDRAWVLERLGEPHRKKLESLLGELQELGIPADRALLAEVTAPSSRSRQEDAESRWIVDLDKADPGILAEVLEHEPPGLVAQVLRIRRWPWGEALLERMPEERRREVEQALVAVPEGQGQGGFLRPFLFRGLHERWRDRNAARAAGAGPSLWVRWGTRIGARMLNGIGRMR